MRRLLSLTAVVPACGAAATIPADATSRGRNGRVTFMRSDDSRHWQVWVASADLTEQTKPTEGPADNDFRESIRPGSASGRTNEEAPR